MSDWLNGWRKKNIWLMIGGAVIVLVCVVALAKVGAIYFSRRTPASTETSSVQLRRVSDVSLQDFNGTAVALAQYIGKPLVVNVWATWCPYCREELPNFVAVKKEFGDRITILAVNRAEPQATAAHYIEQEKFGDEVSFLLDPQDALYKAIGGFSMPETIFVDTNGMIRVHRRGPMSAEEMRRRIEDLINQ